MGFTASRDHEPTTSIALEGGGLLPCPFCGEAEHLYPSHRWPGGGKPYAVDCLGCGIDFTPREGIDVIAAWNRRAPSSAAQIPDDSSRDALESSLSRLKADVVGVLEPFARRCEDALRTDDSDTSGLTVKAGDLRKAAALLSLLREGGMEGVVQTIKQPQCGVGPSDLTDQPRCVTGAGEGL